MYLITRPHPSCGTFYKSYQITKKMNMVNTHCIIIQLKNYFHEENRLQRLFQSYTPALMVCDPELVASHDIFYKIDYSEMLSCVSRENCFDEKRQSDDV